MAKREAPETRQRSKTQKRARDALDVLGGGRDQPGLSGLSDGELKMLFRLYDTNGDGHITREELANAMRSMGRRPLARKLDHMMEVCDTDKNGTIELEEFVKYFRETRFNTAKKSDEDDELFAIDKLLEVREKGDGKKEYLVQWAGYAAEHNSWEPEENIDIPGNEELVEELGKRSASAATGEVKEAKEAKVAEEKKDAEVAPPIQRGLSVTQFYTEFAGRHNDIEGQRDQFNNPQGREFDLGHEGAFSQFRVLVGVFTAASTQEFSLPKFDEFAGKALRDKGFTVETTSSTVDFVKVLTEKRPDAAWIVSDQHAPKNADEFLRAVTEFHHSGGGLAIWGDNTPWFATANAVLPTLCGCRLTDNYPGHKTLALGKGEEKGQFAPHLLTTGITTLFEGVTICKIVQEASSPLKLLATGSDGHPCIGYATNKELGNPRYGRVVVDCGITKLWIDWNTAGTSRYVRNICVWLLGIEDRLGSGNAVQGPL